MIKPTALRPSDYRKLKANRPWIQAILVGIALSGLAIPTLAASHKVRVKDPELARELLQRGGKLIADYGSFQLIETSERVPANGRKVRAQEETKADEIELNTTRINTRSSEGRVLRKARGGFKGNQFHLIQFAGPIKPEWHETVEALGIKFVNYVPQNAYLISGDAAALARLQAWVAATNVVQWDGDFVAEYKLHPGTRTRDEFGQPQTLATDVFAIQLLDDGAANTNTLAMLDRLKLAPPQRDFRVMRFRNLIVRLAPESLPEIAAQSDVISIQPYTAPGKQDERQAQIVAGNITGSSLNGPGYLDWLTAKGFTQEQFDASGFAVDVTDSGIDNGTLFPGHFGLYAGGNPASASRIIYNRLEGTPHSGSTVAGCDGHGNLNAHILGGFNNSGAGFPHTDSAGYHYGLGICPFVKMGSSVVFDPDQFTNPNYADLQSKAYASGARISANSWGATNNSYTMDSQAFDALVRDAQPDGSAYAAPGNQEMVIVFAAGNRGSAANTVGAPGTAKNVITVGASESVRSLNTSNGGKSSMGNDGCGYSDAAADAANDLATFSSRGPCSDGRQKPDLVAPGSHIVGGVPQSIATMSGLGWALSCFKASSLCALSGGGSAGSTNNFFPLGQQFYTVSSGTSHAAPAVAGACALLRQYFLNQNLAAPSPAMTKAFLMNSTRFLTGSGANDSLWSPGQGMGALNIGRAFDGVPRILRDEVEADLFTASGQTRVFTGRIAQTNEPLRITLAWTDAPGSTTGNAFNNDLDLVVEVGGVTYLGNRFSGAYSIASGSADARNNAESVMLPAGTSGDITITVTAANINSDGVPNYGTSLDQDFALVVYNATNTTVPKLSAASAAVIAEGFSPANGAIDPGEMVTINVALRNTGTLAASNLVASLLALNGVSSASSAQSYGNIPTDGVPVSRSFTFIANSGNCGSVINPVIQLQDASGDLGMLTLELSLGLKTVQSVSFTNNTAITIPDSGKASVYPSALVVSDVPGVIQKVTATLRGYSHSWPDDVDVLLVGPGGQKVMLMADCGGGNARNGITVSFDDAAAATAPDSGAITASAYKPTNIDTSTDNLPYPAPSGPFSTSLSVFNNTSPNGTWSLYIQDDGAMDSGSVTQGWVLSITTSNLACVAGAANLANLGVSSQVSTNPVFTSSNFNLTITVTNRGPDAAAFVNLTNTLPTGFVLDALTPSQGIWLQANNTLIWSVGTLDASTGALLTMHGRLLLAGSFNNSCVVSSFTPDPELADNATTITITALKSTGPTIVIATNTPPVLAAIPNRLIHAGATVQFTNVASDTQSPMAGLTFSLLPGAPATANLNPVTGLFTWATTDHDADTTNHVSVQVADNGAPLLTDTESFTITVVSRPLITNIAVTSSVVTVTWTTLPGQSYQLQSATNLLGENWDAIAPNLLAPGDTLTHTNMIGVGDQQFYRVLVLP